MTYLVVAVITLVYFTLLAVIATLVGRLLAYGTPQKYEREGRDSG